MASPPKNRKKKASSLGFFTNFRNGLSTIGAWLGWLASPFIWPFKKLFSWLFPSPEQKRKDFLAEVEAHSLMRLDKSMEDWPKGYTEMPYAIHSDVAFKFAKKHIIKQCADLNKKPHLLDISHQEALFHNPYSPYDLSQVAIKKLFKEHKDGSLTVFVELWRTDIELFQDSLHTYTISENKETGGTLYTPYIDKKPHSAQLDEAAAEQHEQRVWMFMKQDIKDVSDKVVHGKKSFALQTNGKDLLFSGKARQKKADRLNQSDIKLSERPTKRKT